jgi:hypothetical protein
MNKPKKPPSTSLIPQNCASLTNRTKTGDLSRYRSTKPSSLQLKPNQRMVCPNGSASRLSAQLRNWLEKKGHKEPIVRARERCDDGEGGVWWIKEAEKPKTVWRGLEKKAA